MQPQKVVKSALCWIPDARIWPAIQRTRVFNDKGFVRWPPHINLLYPFWEDEGDSFAVASQNIYEVTRSMQPFTVSLHEMGVFDHGCSSTAWLDPQSPALVELQARLAAAFPDCQDLNNDPKRGITAFTPHLSIGQWKSAAAAEEAAAQLQQQGRFADLTASVSQLALISRCSFSDPFEVAWIVPLGTAAGPHEVRRPYIATAGDLQSALEVYPIRWSANAIAVEASQKEVADYLAIEKAQGHQVDDKIDDELLEGGRHAIYFAFGANMHSHKLSGVRGIRPLASARAVLPGFRLAFRHRGGFGTLEPIAGGSRCASGLSGAHGVAHVLSAHDLGQLSMMEHEYLPIEVQVQTYSGQHLQAVAYITPPERLIAPDLLPTERYLELLQRGARECGLHDQYVNWLAGLQGVRERGSEYYTSCLDGSALAPWKKIRSGDKSSKTQSRRRNHSGSR